MTDMANEIHSIDLFSPKTKKSFIKDADLQIPMPEITNGGNLEKNHAFKDILASYVDDVNTLQHDADAIVQRVAAGEIDNPHDVTLAMDEAEKSFQLVLQIHNRLVEAFKDVKGMQM